MSAPSPPTRSRSSATATTEVRRARAGHLRHLAAIEDAGLALYEAELGDLRGSPLAAPAPAGNARVDEPGFLLVALPGPAEAGGERSGVPLGFAHVLMVGHAGDPSAHLEQLSVAPTAMRRGIGSSLVRAALREARAEGARSMTLCTYVDLAWNAPFYAGLGFAEVAHPVGFTAGVREAERRLGLDDLGRRVVMARATGA